MDLISYILMLRLRQTFPKLLVPPGLADDVLDFAKGQVVLWAVDQLQQRCLAWDRQKTQSLWKEKSSLKMKLG